MEKITIENLIATAIVIAVTIVILTFIKQYLIKKVAYRNRKEKKNTSQGLVFNLLQYIVIVLAIFAILTVNGIQVTGLLASLGIVATIVGLSLQDTFKDLFAGINIYENNFYKVGDYVKYNDELCLVKFFNARITKFSSVTTGSTYTVSNNTISCIEKMKSQTLFTMVFDYDVDRKYIDESMEIVAKEMQYMEECISAKYMGIINIDQSGVTYAILYNADPEKQIVVKLEALKVAYDEFKKRDIAPQFDSDRDVVISDKHRVYNNKALSSNRRGSSNKVKAKTKKVNKGK